MLLALGDGRALPAGELAACAGVSAATASGHLGRDARSRSAGREAAGSPPLLPAGIGAGRRAAGIADAGGGAEPGCARQARASIRCCRPDVPATAISPDDWGYRSVTGWSRAERCTSTTTWRISAPRASALLDDFGLDTRALRRQPVSKTCIDWSERRHHLSGPVGVALYRRCLELGWVRHHLDSRAVSVTRAGAKGLAASFGSAFTATI